MTHTMKTAATVLAAAVCLSLTSTAFAPPIPIQLVDLNSSISIDPFGPGMFNWHVDDVDHLNVQWFFYRIGQGDGLSISSLPQVSFTVSDGNLNPGLDRAVVNYVGTGLDITVDVTLAGGPAGSGAAAVDEVITVINTGPAPIDFTLFQYADFDLAGTVPDLTATITGGNKVVQDDVGGYITESIVTGTPSHYQVDVVGAVPAGDDILVRIASGADLLDVAGPVGPGNLTWGFQWDAVLAPNDTLLISKKKNIVPEPGALTLLALGGVLAIRRRRRRSL